MGRDSGIGGLLALLGLALIFSKPSKRTIGGVTPALYYEYRAWATDPEAPAEELEEGPTGKVWRTVTPGRIPTPSGGSIPIPRPFPGGKIDVNKMLNPVEENPTLEESLTVPSGGIPFSERLRVGVRIPIE